MGARGLALPRRLRKRLVQTALLVLLFVSYTYVELPPDSHIRLALRFRASRVANAVRDATLDSDAWLRQPAPYRVDMQEDVGYLIKTGYGTRHRVPLQLAALGGGGLLGQQGKDFVVVGDWTTVDERDARMMGVPVHDVLKTMRNFRDGQEWREHHRLKKYQSLQEAIGAGDEETALEIARSVGWELDALKFAPGMELMYRTMPDKKWYLILDDDTFIIKSSLHLLLTHLNPDVPHYLGNAVGDYKGRFAHGGSGIVVSAEVMRRLFRRRDVVRQAYVDSLGETWGDKLVATTLLRLGIYLEERYAHHFNGEPPEETRITGGRFCSPIMSFHALRGPGDMQRVANVLGEMGGGPVRWGELMERFTRVTRAQKQREGEGEGEEEEDDDEGYQEANTEKDHVGRPETNEVITWKRVERAADCRAKCEEENGRWCLAWTYDRRKEECYASPWMLPGTTDVQGDKESDYNQEAFKWLQASCR